MTKDFSGVLDPDQNQTKKKEENKVLSGRATKRYFLAASFIKN